MIRAALILALLASPSAAQMVGGPETSAAAAERHNDAFLLRGCIGANIYSRNRIPEMCIGSVAAECRNAGRPGAECDARDAAAWADVLENAVFQMRRQFTDDAGRAAFEAALAAAAAAKQADCEALSLFMARSPDMVEREVAACRVRHDAFLAILLETRMAP